MIRLNDRINAICLPEMGNPESAAEVLEALANALAGTIAILARGDKKKADDLLTGVEGYVQNCLSDKMAAMKKMGLM